MRQTNLPDSRLQIEEGPGSSRTASSNNLLTDTRIEIEGIQTGPYPVVVDDPVNRTLTLTFDYVEGGGILDGFARSRCRAPSPTPPTYI